MKKLGQKKALIDSATTLFHHNGYANTGARDIAAAAGVPQGSFTNHFRSKDVLGVAALDSYFEQLGEILRATLEDHSSTPEDRLLGYFELIAARLAAAGWRRGCLIPDLAAEIPVHSEVIRLRLSEVMVEQVSAFEAVVAEIVSKDEARDLAAFIVSAWHGTLLRMKVERSPEPVNGFLRVVRRLIENASRR